MSNSHPASIDVLIPAYNAAGTIEASLRCIQEQTVRDIRIVVVNDGSTDRTAEILRALAAQDARIHVVDRPNGGIVDALNEGLDHCTAEFVARHDADDIAFPDRFEQQLAHLRAHQQTIAVSSNVHIIDETGARTGRRTDFKETDGADASHLPPREPFLMHPFLMVRREVVERVGRYRYVFHAEDADLYWRLLPIGKLENFGVFGEYRVHSGSLTSQSVRNGRVNAINAQLAGISHLRRLAGRPDLVFEKVTLNRYHDAGQLDAMVAIAGEQLDEDERRRLTLGTAAKLVEMATYRPYSIEYSDCRFVRRAFADNLALASKANRHSLESVNYQLRQVLIARGHLGLAAAISSPRLYPKIAARHIVNHLRRWRASDPRSGKATNAVPSQRKSSE